MIKEHFKGRKETTLKAWKYPFWTKMQSGWGFFVFFFFWATVSDFSYSSSFMELANILHFRQANPIKSEESTHILLACQSVYGVRKTQFQTARGVREGEEVFHRIAGFFIT